MKTFQNWIILMAILALSTASSCKKKPTPNLCDSNPCAKLQGFDCVEGACQCATGKIKIGDCCIASLEPYQYFGVGCTLFDTIILSVGAYNQLNEQIPVKYRTSSERIGFTRKGGESPEFTGYRYRDNNKNLDSLHFWVDGGQTYRIKDTISCFVIADGRFLDNDKLRLRFRYHATKQNNRVVDSCTMILHK